MEQNRIRDMEMKNKLTVTREEGESDNGTEKGKSHQGTYLYVPCLCMEKGNRLGGTKSGWWVWVGRERVMKAKWGQL